MPLAPPVVSPAPPVTPPPAITGVVSAPPAPAPALPESALPEAALAAWRVIGQEPSWEKAEPLFVQTTGHTPTVFQDMVAVLMQQDLLSLFKAPVAKVHEVYCNPRLFELTPAGVAGYAAQFGLAPVTLSTFSR